MGGGTTLNVGRGVAHKTTPSVSPPNRRIGGSPASPRKHDMILTPCSDIIGVDETKQYGA
jgi:hypothetical protein